MCCSNETEIEMPRCFNSKVMYIVHFVVKHDSSIIIIKSQIVLPVDYRSFKQNKQFGDMWSNKYKKIIVAEFSPCSQLSITLYREASSYRTLHESKAIQRRNHPSIHENQILIWLSNSILRYQLQNRRELTVA